jgi:FdhD protein
MARAGRMKSTEDNSKSSSKSIPIGAKSADYISFGRNGAQAIKNLVVEETLACISVNGAELANFMCSPSDLELLAIGFLYNEGVIGKFEDIDSLHVSDSHCVEIWIKNEYTVPDRLIITAGCGGGLTFDDLSTRHEPLQSDFNILPAKLSELMKEVHQGSLVYQQAGGIHTAALSDGENILFQVEDLGRHNCIDKIAGASLKEGITTNDKILFSSGRISSEMINKARRLQIPIVCSRTSPTSLSVALAEEWNITLVGYIHQNNMRIYSAPERLVTETEKVQ